MTASGTNWINRLYCCSHALSGESLNSGGYAIIRGFSDCYKVCCLSKLRKVTASGCEDGEDK